MCTHTDQVHHEQDLELAVVAKVQMSHALCQSPEGSEECPTSFSEKNVTKYNVIQTYENNLIATNGP